MRGQPLVSPAIIPYKSPLETQLLVGRIVVRLHRSSGASETSTCSHIDKAVCHVLCAIDEGKGSLRLEVAARGRAEEIGKAKGAQLCAA